jgi:quinoprotein glucose dehydrogenase
MIALLVLLVALLTGGIWLAALGGSLYYAMAGTALLTVALLLRSRRNAAQLLYAALLAGTAIWALWESGYDWWPLATRLGILLLLAIPLLWPSRQVSRVPLMVLFGIWTVSGLILVSSVFNDAHRIVGELTTESVVSDPDLGLAADQNDWPSYGRSHYGQRYSPLDQITPANVAELELAWEYQTGDLKGPEDVNETTYEATPLKIGNSLFLYTA